MSTSNMKQARKWATYYGIECQPIEGSKPTNCKAIIVGGKQFSTSNWTGVEFESFFAEIACKQNVEGMSVASQKINDVHGRTDGEKLVNFIKQYMTYASQFKNIQFFGQTWISVFNQLLERETENPITEYSYWKNVVKDLHKNKDIEKLINNKDLFIMNGHIIPSITLKCFLDKWTKENQEKPISDYAKEYMINAYYNRHKQLIENTAVV